MRGRVFWVYLKNDTEVFFCLLQLQLLQVLLARLEVCVRRGHECVVRIPFATELDESEREVEVSLTVLRRDLHGLTETCGGFVEASEREERAAAIVVCGGERRIDA